MDVQGCLVAVLSCILLLIWAWKILNWVWFRPKKMEKLLRREGLSGNPYRLLVGDSKEAFQMLQEAESKPFGFTHDIVPRVMSFTEKAIKNHGKHPFVWMGPKPGVVIKDPELLKEIFTKGNIYQKVITNDMSSLLVQGLATLDGQKWSKHRRIINPAFHMEKLKKMLPAFELSCSEMMSKWEKITTAEGSTELDVFPDLQTLTSDAISRTAFGSNYEEGKQIFERQKEMSELILELEGLSYIPGLRFLPTKKARRIHGLAKESRSLILSIIHNRLKVMEGGEANADDLLGILLESNLKEIKEHGSKKFGMSFEEVIHECRLFYFAGQETTSNLLAWTLILLGKHSDWQARARDEVMKVFGNKKPDFEGLNHLKVVTMIFNEVLRLYPAVSMFSRTVHEETKLGELTLPAGTILFMPSLMVHRDQNIWGDDTNEFNPERFSEGTMKATKGQLAYFPFGWGPRICIGQNFAMLEAKLAMAMILQRFSFELSPFYAHAPRSVITLQPQYGAQLILRKV